MVEINPVSTAAAKREKAILKRKRYEQLMQGLPIKLALSRTKGRHCVALSKLPAGTTVISETASAHVLLRPLVDELCLKCLQPLPFIETSSKPPAPAVSGGGFLSMSSRLAKRGICCGNCRKQTFYCSYACMESDSERHELECQVLIDLPGITAMHKCDYNLFRLVLSLLVNMALQRTEMLVFDSMDKLYEIRQKCPTPYSYVKDLISHKASQGKNI